MSTPLAWIMFLVTYASCSEPALERVAGPFADVAACEARAASVARAQGPPAAGQRLECRQR